MQSLNIASTYFPKNWNIEMFESIAKIIIEEVEELIKSGSGGKAPKQMIEAELIKWMGLLKRNTTIND